MNDYLIDISKSNKGLTCKIYTCFDEFDKKLISSPHLNKSNYKVFLKGRCYSVLTNKQLDRQDISNMFAKYGEKIFKYITGTFNIAIWNEFECIIFRDPLNVSNTYYFHSNSRMQISSSLTLLSDYLKAKKIYSAQKPNHGAILETYFFDYLISDESFIEGIYTIPTGYFLKYTKGQISLKKYFDYFKEFEVIENQKWLTDDISEIHKILENNIERSLIGPEDTAIAFTGGYDSRVIASSVSTRSSEYNYFSYGIPQNWDYIIPNRISKKLGLKYSFIDLTTEFLAEFEKYALEAVVKGDGLLEYNRGSYFYVYKNHLLNKKNFISGLFGSELIKNPTSRGLFWDENILSLIKAEDVEAAFSNLYFTDTAMKEIHKDVLHQHYNTIKTKILNHPVLSSSIKTEKKLFYFLLHTGIRRYFSKEIKAEQYFIENNYPFFDVTFIKALLQTSYPWIYNWSGKKNLIKNLKIHTFYAKLIEQNNKQLLGFISTHGYRPIHLLNKMSYPFIAAEFLSMKRKVKYAAEIPIEKKLIDLIKKRSHLFSDNQVFTYSGISSENDDLSRVNKNLSLLEWYNGINIHP